MPHAHYASPSLGRHLVEPAATFARIAGTWIVLQVCTLIARKATPSACSVWERPYPQFLFSDLPEPGEPGWFDDQKEDDQHHSHERNVPIVAAVIDNPNTPGARSTIEV
jgi:hypothetical protein